MMQRPALTVLVDNQVGPGCAPEHGFALWIETRDRRILLDTGQGPALAGNALALGVDLGRANVLVLSHGHYDHTGAVPLVLAGAPEVNVHAHAGVTEPRYSIREDAPRDIRMPAASVRALYRLPLFRMHWASGPVSLGEGMGLSGAIPRRTDFEDTGGPFYLDPEGQRPDLLDDDQALWIATDAGLVVCLGCCHSGLINTLTYVQEITGESRIHAVIGGLHLGAASPERLKKTVSALHELRPDMLVPCHCTGEAATTYLRDHLACPVHTGYAGFRLDMAQS
jgi:7,8-dihydropterin-6-yl-methyl-4-(beta-D-ribofuranosyl)aminobenzene 5'-phosphate synthase